MRSVMLGSKGVEVRLVQGMLMLNGFGLDADGSFGDKTRVAVTNFQKLHGLQPDGVCGSMTQAALGFVQPLNQRICVLKIPFSRIDKAQVCLANKKKRTVATFARDYDCNIVVNGGLFSNFDNANCTDIVLGGVLMGGGNYSDKGIAFGNNFGAVGAYPSTTSNSIRKPVDFMGGCPQLIQEGKKSVDLKGLSNAFMRNVTRRMATGLTSDALIFMFSLKNVDAYSMQKEGLSQGLTFLMNHDGGGSQSVFIGNTTVIPTDGRGIPSAIGIKIKPR